MSLLFFEGFETVGTSLGLANQATTRPHIERRWDFTGSGGAPATDSFFLIDDAFTEGFAVNLGTNAFSNGNYLRWEIPTAYDDVAPGTTGVEFICGARVYIPPDPRTIVVFQVMASFGSGTGANDFGLAVVDSTDLQLFRFPSTQVDIVTDVLTPGTWHYLEVKFLYSSGGASNGTYEVFLDGVSVMSSGAARINGNFFTQLEGIRLQNCNSPSATNFAAYDDIYIAINDGAGLTAPVGPTMRIISYPVDSDASPNAWTPSTGSDNYALVDENGADSSDYVESSTDTQVDRYTHTAAAGVSIVGVKLEAEVIQVGGSAATVHVQGDSGGTVDETTELVDNTSASKVVEHYMDVDPDTSANWSLAGFNAMTVGVEYEA